MTSKGIATVTAASFAFVALLSGGAFAQGETAAIAGVVRDATGAVIPGVTVEASSPALIERLRTAVTDSQGQYKIIDLRPGTYAVTFTLSGFNTFRREGIELSTSFTATVNADLRVGQLEETVTVSGQSPVVDVQNVAQEKVMTRDVIDTLPGAKTFATFALLVPGVVVSAPDVGGSFGDLSVTLTVHGTRTTESQIQMDGMSVANGLGSGGIYYGEFLNSGMMQEINIETGGMSADQELAGVRSNVIPREGGNAFKGMLTLAYTDHRFNSSNLSAAEQAQNTEFNSVNRIYDFNPSAGGSIIRDRLWMFLSFREWGSSTTRAGASGVAYPNLTPASSVYTPDLTRRALDHAWHLSASDRMTWQVSQKHKVNVFYEFQNHEFEFANNSVGSAPEVRPLFHEVPQYIIQSSWSAPVTSRLLFEAGATLAANDFPETPEPDVVRGVPPITELTTNFTYRANATGAYGHNRSDNYNYRASASYVTGSHAFKTGLTLMHTWLYQTTEPNSTINLYTRNGVPTALQEWATPITYHEKMNYNLGLFVQDRWTLRRLTLNLGVRTDFLNSYIQSQSLAAGLFVPARNFPEVDNVPNWKDINPRVGVTWDVFGDAKTAFKASLGRYVVGQGLLAFTKVVDPEAATVNTVMRTWTDVSGTFNPFLDCDLHNTAANGGCGAIQNANFGKSVPTTSYAADVSQGFGVRPYNWEAATSVQRELMPGVSAGIGYTRRWYGNFLVTQNVLVNNASYSPYCVTEPVDPRLPTGGGNQLCGLYDVNGSAFGQFNNVISRASHFGTQQDVYDGFDINFNARLPRKIVLSGGLTDGRERTNNCFELTDLSLVFPGTASGVTSPRTTAFCDVRPPFQPNVKFYAIYPLPWWDLQTSATFYSQAGPQITASYSAANAQIFQSLGRNLSSGSNGTVLLDLVPPGTMYADRLNQLDFRVTKRFKLALGHMQAQFDLYNLLNANPPLSLQTRYGSAWQTPTLTLIGRLAKFGLLFDF